MTYWAHAAWCITQNLQSFQVSYTVNIQTSTHPSNERRINVQRCIMSTCGIMTAGYFPFERMPEWGCGLQSMNSWWVSSRHTEGVFWNMGVPVFLWWGPKVLKWTRGRENNDNDKSGAWMTTVSYKRPRGTIYKQQIQVVSPACAFGFMCVCERTPLDDVPS